MTNYKLLIFGINFLFFISLIVLFFSGCFLIGQRKKIIGTTIIFSLVLIDLFLSTQTMLLTSSPLSIKTQTIPNNSKVYTIPSDQKPQTAFFTPDIEVEFAKQKMELLLPNQNIYSQVYSEDGYASMAIASYINQFTNSSKTVTGLGKLDVGKIDFSKHGVNFIISEDYIKKINSRERYFLGKSGEIKIIKETPQELVFSVNTEPNNTLVILDSWYPGWHATVDDKPVDIEKFENIYKKISVPEGSHIVRFYFYPKSFVMGGIITLVFIIIVIVSLPILWLLPTPYLF